MLTEVFRVYFIFADQKGMKSRNGPVSQPPLMHVIVARAATLPPSNAGCRQEG